jgi:hypothetical protein
VGRGVEYRAHLIVLIASSRAALSHHSMSDLIRDADTVLQDEVVGVVNDVIKLLVRSS